MSRVTNSADDKEALLTIEDDQARSETWHLGDTTATEAESNAGRCYIPLTTHISKVQRADGQSNSSGQNSPGYKHPKVNAHPGEPRVSSADNSTQLISVAVVQPEVTTTVSVESVVSNYTALSVFTMLCCCLPLGLCALFYARDAQTMWLRGYIQEALKRSRSSRAFNIAGIAIGAVVMVTLAVLLSLLVKMIIRDLDLLDPYYRYH